MCVRVGVGWGGGGGRLAGPGVCMDVAWMRDTVTTALPPLWMVLQESYWPASLQAL